MAIHNKRGKPMTAEVKADYESAGYSRTLLFEYVRYARDGALDVFENNYMSMILAMQNQRAVQVYAENAIPAE